MACGYSTQVIYEDVDTKRWPVKTGGLSSEVNYITNSYAPRNIWPVKLGGLSSDMYMAFSAG